MEQILIIVQGLVYSGPVATLLANRLSRGRSGTAPVLAAGGPGLLSLLERPAWLVFRLPGHIVTHRAGG